MSSKWHQKKAKLAEEQFERELQNQKEYVEKDQANAAAMGEGDEELFEKKLTKEEKKALAKQKRLAKKEKKGKSGKSKKGADDDEDSGEKSKDEDALLAKALEEAQKGLTDLQDRRKDNPEAEALAADGTICTFATSRKGVDERSRDINVTNVTLLHKGTAMLDQTDVVLNHGNRYGLIGRNGCGKTTLLKVLGARVLPIPDSIDSYHLKEEIEPSDTLTALDAVMSVDKERQILEQEAEKLNQAIGSLSENPGESTEEQQEVIMEILNEIYDRLDALDADTAETRARSILKGLGFTHQMQSKKTKDFSGGWRMRVSLARALFLQPTLLLLDEPTNHLDMEAVIWLEDYLSKWDKILFLVSHSQDFLNNVCTNMVHMTDNKLVYYDGNYDQFIKTKSEKEENDMKRYKWEQDQIKSMKQYIAKFGHGTSKNAKQAQSKEKVLEKMIRAGLTEKPKVEKLMNFTFPSPGHLPPPVLSFRDVSFAYPKCEPLYDNVNFGVDLDSRVALVGPNGAGKTTLVKLMSGELEPSMGDIRPHGHLKLGRFTQHFVDVLDLEKTPLEFFESLYPNDPKEDLRKYLGRFGVSGKMQMQQMEQLSDGQKSRVVFAKLGRECPHILLLDEPTNHLDMESIDALAQAVNCYDGGMVLVSHDMRLISQVAKEIWICDHKSVKPYRGDIQNFKMDMRSQMGISGKQASSLRGDASIAKPEPKSAKKKDESKKETKPIKTEQKITSYTSKAKNSTTKLASLAEKPSSNLPSRNNTRNPILSQLKQTSTKVPVANKIEPKKKTKEEIQAELKAMSEETSAWDDSDEEDDKPSPFETSTLKKSLPNTTSSGGRYIPPHLRNR